MKCLLKSILFSFAIAFCGVIAFNVGSADAAMLSSSFENRAVSSFDLDAQGYADWGRWDQQSDDASISMQGGNIINRTISDTSGSLRTFTGNRHSFVQGDGDRMTSYAGAGASFTLSYDLAAMHDYTIEVFSRVIPEGVAADRNDVEFAASLGSYTDTFTITKSEVPNDSGAVIYTLNVSYLALTSPETLNITLTSLDGDGRAVDQVVRFGATGVYGTYIPEPSTTMILGALTLLGVCFHRPRRK